MAAALALADEHDGKLERRGHDWWTYSGASSLLSARSAPDWTVMHATVEALVRRGRMKFTEYRTCRGGRRPIAAEVVR